MSAHTPGPWEINGDQYVEALSLDTPLSVCTLADCGEATESNGALIAAAPDLLNMLRNAENWFREYDVQNGPDSGAQLLLEDIRAAIAKATGGAP